jgi:hypothetical protein
MASTLLFVADFRKCYCGPSSLRIASSAASITPGMLTRKTATSYDDPEMLFHRQSVTYDKRV